MAQRGAVRHVVPQRGPDRMASRRRSEIETRRVPRPAEPAAKGKAKAKKAAEPAPEKPAAKAHCFRVALVYLPPLHYISPLQRTPLRLYMALHTRAYICIPS